MCTSPYPHQIDHFPSCCPEWPSVPPLQWAWNTNSCFAWLPFYPSYLVFLPWVFTYMYNFVWIRISLNNRKIAHKIGRTTISRSWAKVKLQDVRDRDHSHLIWQKNTFSKIVSNKVNRKLVKIWNANQPSKESKKYPKNILS